MTQTTDTPNVFDAMRSDDRFLGWGYIGAREGNYRDETEWFDAKVIEYAREHGWSDDDLFTWANSKNGRWFADVTFGGAGVRADRFAEAVRHGLLVVPR